jgi:lysophospholipase L1-like esterase
VSDRIHVINVDQYFLDGMGAIRRWDSEGNDLFLDSTHLSASGAQLVARELVAVLEAP